MKKSIFLLLCVIAMSACRDHKDLYNPEGGSESGKDNPLEMEVSKDFDWSMQTTLNVVVNVDDQYDGQYNYVVEVYDSNPVISSEATLLARGKAKKEAPYTIALTVGKGLETVYVKQIDPTKLTRIRAFSIEGNMANCDFTATPSGRSLSLRSVSRTFVDMEIPADDVFPSEVPSGLSEFDSNSFAANSAYRVTSKTESINLGGITGITLYVVEDVTLSSMLYLTSGSKIYVLSGKKLEMPASTNNGQDDCIISIGADASLVVDGNIQLDSNYKLYNRGNVTAENFPCTNTSYLYNEGTVTLLGKLSGENAESNILNLGMISAKELAIQGNSHFENRGTVEIEGTSTVNCSGGSWRNEGVYTTGNMNISAWNEFISNACKLVVNNKLSLTDGKMKVDGSVMTKDLTIRNFRVELAGGTFFNITGTAEYGYNALEDHGFYATASERALLRVNQAQNVQGGACMTYGGPLTVVYVSKEISHPVKSPDGGSNFNWREDSSVNWADEAENKTDLVISESNCNPGYGHEPSEPEEPEIEELEAWAGIYAMEDNWPIYGDYDMNDVVVKVAVSMNPYQSNYIKEADVEVWLMAVGADKTIAAAVQLDKVTPDMLRTSGDYSVKHDEPADIAEFSVVSNTCYIEQGQKNIVLPLFTSASRLLGGNYVNVGRGQNKQSKKLQVNLRFEDGKVTRGMLQSVNFNFFITTDGVQNGRTEIHLRNFAVTDLGNASLLEQKDDSGNFVSASGLVWGLLIPSSSWKWPDENDDIKRAYPEFESWATSNGTQNAGWYNHPASSN